MSSFGCDNDSPYDSSTNGCQVRAQFYEYRGKQVTGFDIDEKQMVCLPQVYELFLKQLVSGLHTVYTKLKRLNIHPVICNVDQVRALRSLGAIQPGVNRCKLIDKSDFDKLYDDCTSSGSRPGRPPKRCSPMPDFRYSKREKSNYDSDSSSFYLGPTTSYRPLSLDVIPALRTSADPNSQDNNNTLMPFPQLLPLTAQQILVQQLMAAATLASQQQNNLRELKNYNNENGGDEICKADSKNCQEKREWNKGGKNKGHKISPVSPNGDSESSNENSGASTSLPSISLNSGSESSDNFSFDREKSNSLMNNSASEREFSSGSSSDTSTNVNDVQIVINKFSRTVDVMEKRFKDQYEKLTTMAGNLQKTLEEMDKRESNLFKLLDGHKERSRKLTKRAPKKKVLSLF
uniref:SKI/SNO/DAC domain-containing protein n=1 Tax=Panagrolaimus sp. ES5 TaxID=591445 RepID=A0AC34FPE9_9BILA